LSIGYEVSDLAIKASGLGKRYQISVSGRGLPYETLRESLSALFGRAARAASRADGLLWALRDVSFEVATGEVLGVIGSNGAGKSTLLRVLSRITDPTEGFAEISGRVACLLEVGTGFHPELTGRENIYLSGAILGMRRAEIARRFDEIVSFAETEDFLDLPVKRYSSGMYLRLAFAVAAHLEPEILIIDEILAVGDAAFQKKVLGKMGDVAKGGRTVLFVSHNMGAIRTLCSRALVFNAGRIAFDGSPDEAIARYLKSSLAGLGEREGRAVFPADETQRGEMALREIRLVDGFGQVQGSFDARDPIRVEMVYELRARLRGMRATLQISTREGEQAFASTDELTRDAEQPPGLYQTTCVIPGALLNRRMYVVEIGFEIPAIRTILARKGYLSFMVVGGGNHGSNHPERWPGVVCPLLDWKTDRV
jgi:lipopolysaccharide transport system ATP-binding protein